MRWALQVACDKIIHCISHCCFWRHNIERGEQLKRLVKNRISGVKWIHIPQVGFPWAASR